MNKNTFAVRHLGNFFRHFMRKNISKYYGALYRVILRQCQLS